MQIKQDTLKPDHSRDSPEKAVQKIDSAAQIKRKLTVVPKYFSKKNLCKHTAKILITTAKQCSHHKKKTVTVVFIFIKKQCYKSQCQSPHNAEQSPDKTTPTHPVSHGNTAENGLYNISQKSSNDKQKHEFIKAAPLCKNTFLCRFLCFPNLLYFWISFTNPFLDPPRDQEAQMIADFIQLFISCCPLFQMLFFSFIFLLVLQNISDLFRLIPHISFI